MYRNTVLIDLDDTIIQTNVIYREAISQAARLCEIHGLASYDEAVQKIGEIDMQSAKENGFHQSRFPQSLEQTYLYFCTVLGCEIIPEVQKTFGNIGWNVYKTVPELHDDTLGALQQLSDGFNLILVTKGDEEIQRLRIGQTNIEKYFERIFIVPHKTTKEYQEVLDAIDLDASRVWMIGDSIKSDINPSTSLGMKAIQVRYNQDPWAFEHEEATGEFFVVNNLTEAMEILWTIR